MSGSALIESQPLSPSPEPFLMDIQSESPRSPLWARRMLWIAFAIVSGCILFLELIYSINDMTADHRLAPSFAIVHGYHLYYPPDHGPVLSTIYGPVTALFYLPATLGSSPHVAFLIAALLTLITFYAATLFAVGTAPERSWLKRWQLFALVVGLVWFFPPLQRVATSIHADAPAFAAAAVAAAFAMRNKWRLSRWENELLAGIFSVLSVFAKQNMAPLVIVLALWFTMQSRKALGVYTGAVLGCAGVLLAITARYLGGLDAFYFNCVYMPLHQPYDKKLLFPAYTDLLIPTVAILSLPLVRLVDEWRERTGGWREFVVARRSLLLLLIGVALVPTSVAGRIKFGGYENALAPALYFFLMWAIAELSNGTATASFTRQRSSILAMVMAACILGGLPAIFIARKASYRNPAERVFDYCKSNPSKAYFPQFPLAQLMSEGKLYHFNWGLADRHAAGVPVSREHFIANIPPDASVMAMTPWVPEWDREMDSRHGPAVNFDDAAQLPGFNFYSMHNASADNKARP